MTDLFSALGDGAGSMNIRREDFAPGAVLLRGGLADQQEAVLAAVRAVTAQTAFRRMQTPGGQSMSVATSSCGALGWVTDRKGYRYVAADPQTGIPWPVMPGVLHGFARAMAEMAGYPGFDPDSCLINRYAAGVKMGLHQDRDEADFTQPIVSLSLGIPAVFLWGGLARTGPVRRITLSHGDVVVWGGPSRLVFHGIAPLKPGTHPATGEVRINLTFRRAG
ncbi:DNA oxidative demethylase AlkB [Novispirillum itersonii]|uniref:Alkylated DNA repair protein (DNA oxidative demethylase) n=1 Tax=Novispirillum itersonii TaxID=189 RepID=A0A7X0DND1_NOVIT|nr:DNA oxidative demethylase AlkB [Novispirillum itersonii]MBB6211966.1 alkylated DNA repair protein (DNA oxidative demethylase) [Novispirillum itersonii]